MRLALFPFNFVRSKQEFTDTFFLKNPVCYQLEREDGSPFFNKFCGAWRHGAGGNASNISMVTAAGDPENDGFILENRGHDSDVRQVAASCRRMVGHQYITRGKIRTAANLFPDCLAHCTKMNRNMGGIGHQVAIRAKEGAGKIQSLLDVCGNGGFLQHTSHLFGNGHEQVGKYGELNRIHLTADLFGMPAVHCNSDITKFSDFSAASGFHKNSGGVLDQDCRALDYMSSSKIIQVIEVCILHPSIKITGDSGVFFGISLRLCNGKGQQF